MTDTAGFCANRLAQILRCEFELGDDTEIYVGFSGGLDSTVLLHSLARIPGIERDRITALHVNHGLHDRAGAWEQHCLDLCCALRIRCFSRQLDCTVSSGKCTEASARKARYRWFEEQMSDGAVLMTAHHASDQAETILANLFRGSGAQGMAGIRKSRPFGTGNLWRPLLDIERHGLEHYAKSHELNWVEDPMNEDLSYTRNHLRHRVLPVVREKWPGATKTIARAAINWRDTVELLDEFARMDLSSIPHRRESQFDILSVPKLGGLSTRRKINVLRHWFVQCGYQIPARAHLQSVINHLIDIKPKTTSVLAWTGVEVRRYRDWLYLSAPVGGQAVPSMAWDPHAPEDVLINGRILVARPTLGKGIKKTVYDCQSISVGPRRGGERCRLPGRGIHQKLKKLFQESGVPPWQRDQIPLLYVGEALAGVVGHWYCQPFAACKDEAGMIFELIEPVDTINAGK
jgi:tRNA(Ile)-lysidine synthase